MKKDQHSFSQPDKARVTHLNWKATVDFETRVIEAVATWKFEAAPDKYLTKQPEPPPTKAQAAALYTCPMHPEVVQVGPGACPKCGMALEPKDVSLEPADDGRTTVKMIVPQGVASTTNSGS